MATRLNAKKSFLSVLLSITTCSMSSSIAGNEAKTEGKSLSSPNATPDPIERELGLQASIVANFLGQRQQASELLEKSDAISDRYLRGVYLLEEEQLEEAESLFSELATDPSAPSETWKLLAVTRLHLEDSEGALEAIDRYQETDAADHDSYAHYVRGMALAQMGDRDAAFSSLSLSGMSDDEIEQHVHDSPMSLVSYQLPSPAIPTQNVGNYGVNRDAAQRASLNYSARMPEPRRFHFTLLTANEYDSNVGVAPNFTGLGAISNKDDSRFVVASFFDFLAVKTEDVNFGLIASTYNTFQYDLDRFNLGDYMGGAYANVLLTENYFTGVRYEFHETEIDSRRFAREHRLVSSLTRLGDLGHTTSYYEFNPLTSFAPALIPEQNQSGDGNSFGITQALYTQEGQGRIYAGYRYDKFNTIGSDFDRHSHMATARIERPMKDRSWIWDGEVRHFWTDYDNPNSLDFFGNARTDQRTEVRTGLQKNFLSTRLSGRLDYTFIDNDSNVANLFGVHFYAYQRHILSTQLIYSF